MKTSLLQRTFGETIVVWLPRANKYVLVAQDRLEEARDQLMELDESDFKSEEEIAEVSVSEVAFPISHRYLVGKTVLNIDYSSEYLEHIIHPKLFHLEIEHVAPDKHLQVMQDDVYLYIFVDGAFKWRWKREEENFFLGKVAMEVLNAVYDRDESDWLAVLHAAGISNGKESIAFLGDCGAGKSSFSALALAKGFEVLADDFLAMDVRHKHVHTYPAALKIKGDMVEVLDKDYPELQQYDRRTLSRSGNLLRYLSGISWEREALHSYACETLVFIEYNSASGVELEPMDRVEALEELIPQAWISPEHTHAEAFLDWMQGVRCFRLRYGDNEKVMDCLGQLFADEV